MARPLLVLATLLLLSGCGSSPKSSSPPPAEPSASTSKQEAPAEPTQDLADFLKERIEFELKGQYSRSYATLHPGQQKIVPLSRYDDCRRQVSDQVAGMELTSLKVEEIYEDTIDVPGVPQKKAKAVTIKMTLRDSSGQEGVENDTWHVVAVNGHWVWMLAPSQIKAFQDGTCPT